MSVHPFPTASNASKNLSDADFIAELKKGFQRSGTEFARAYYLFATARLSKAYNSQEIHDRYPVLGSKETIDRLQTILKAETLVARQGNPQDSEVHHLFVSAIEKYLDGRLAKENDEFENELNLLKVSVSELNLKDDKGELITELLYEDTPGYLKKIPDAESRQALYDLKSKVYQDTLSGKFIDLLRQENTLMSELGHPDVRDFHAWASGHNFPQLGEQAERLLQETQSLYTERMSAHYHARTGRDFKTQATRADISYTLHGPSDDMAGINASFSQENMVPLAQKTFDRLGLRFSELAQPVDFQSMDEYNKDVVEKTDNAKTPVQRILLDIARREGKPSRAYVYPATIPSEVYLSVKPEGGLDDYLSFFHEAGHAQHFAYENPENGYVKNQMGNNTSTESYAYLFQNLFLNRHWLEHEAGLSAEDARKVVRKRALEDLYMLRRYSAKMIFELGLFENVNDPAYTIDGQGDRYAELLTRGCGFRYNAGGWTSDVDARFYVADYFTAWSLEAQLRQTLCTKFGSSSVEEGEDWYLNPAAGAFLMMLWKQGNISQLSLAKQLGYDTPTDLTPLLHFMNRNL